jgi:hypothetical protein
MRKAVLMNYCENCVRMLKAKVKYTYDAEH